jgi:hypothetical protein
MYVLEFSIVTITAFVAALNEVTKLIFRCVNKNVDRFIPIFSLVFGVALGVWGYYIPDVDMGKNIIEAVFIGLSAGAAATGCHQVYKQLSKKDKSDKDEPGDGPSDDYQPQHAEEETDEEEFNVNFDDILNDDDE